MCPEKAKPIDELQVEVFRLTAFLSPRGVPKEQNWFKDVTGNAPDSETTRAARGEHSASGVFAGKLLTLSIQPDRIDWILSPNQQVQDAKEPDAIIGSRKESLDLFVPRMMGWLKTFSESTRMAFGAVLRQPVADRVSGYKQLMKFLHKVTIDAENSQDLFYQINRPRPSQVLGANVLINRLSKWTVAQAQFLRLVVGGKIIAPYTGGEEFMLRLELDISTPPEVEKALPQAKLPDILKELVDFGVEISERGDV